MDLLIEHVNKGMLLVLALSLPCVLVAATIGLVVGILQAVTQVQEQTIAAAPKIICVFLVLILGGGIMLNVTQQYVRESFILAFQEIPKQETFILPPRATEDETMNRARTFFRKQVSAGNGKLSTMKASPTGIGEDGKGNQPMPVMQPESGGNRNSLSERMGLGER